MPSLPATPAPAPLAELRAALARAARSLLDWRLLALAGICCALLLLAAQAPLRYAFQPGMEPGPRSDWPFLKRFNPGEFYPDGTSWRWTRGESRVEVPGIGQRAVIVAFEVVSLRADWQPGAPPQVLTVGLRNGAALPITLRRQPARYALYVPAAAMAGGPLRLDLATPPWRIAGDPRDELGVALGGLLTIASVPAPGLARPDPGLVIAWPLGVGLLWVALRILDIPRQSALLLLLPLALGLPLLALTEAPRLGAGNRWAVQSGLLATAAALICAALAPPLLRRLAAPAPPALLRWLLLLMVVSFVIKFGGQLYPTAIPGDLQLHANRYTRTIGGQIYIMAQHRGLPFPFPNGLYLLIAPLTLGGLDVRPIFEFLAGVFDASGVLLIYILLARPTGSARHGIFAAAVYALAAVGFMNTWFSFQTQVATQWLSALLMTVLVVRWPHYSDRATWWLLALLLVLVFLGHIGTFINMALLGLAIIPVLWLRFRDGPERRAAPWLLAAGAAAGAFTATFYYSASLGLFVEQLVGAATVGLAEVTNRQPVTRPALLGNLWNEGLILHYGFFPVPLALIGAWLAGRGRLRRSILPVLLWLTFAIALLQGLVPLLTLTLISTRWLTFAAWAVAVGSAFSLAALWRRGRAARLVALAALGYVAWLSAAVWIGAMALRIVPVEPF